METAVSTAVHHDGNETISILHSDIIQSHILTRLDGPSLASLSCTSSHFHALSAGENLWREICYSTWPSVDHPRLQSVIPTFPAGHRSFLSDSLPLLDPQPSKLDANSSTTLPTTLISAVDISYQNEVIFSKVEEMETSSNWFLSSVLRVDLLDQKESAPTPIKYFGGSFVDTWLKHLEENLRLSWIIIDPTRMKAVNISTRKAVSVHRHWLTGDVQARFGTVTAGNGRRGSSTESVFCGISVTCGGKEGGEMHVIEVSMVIEDLEGKGLNGKDSLAILTGVMENGMRKIGNGNGNGNEGKVKYVEFEEKKKERKENKQREERTIDMVCITIGIVGFLAFWSVIIWR